MTLSLWRVFLYMGVMFSASLILWGEWYSLIFKLYGKVFHLLWQGCMLSSPSSWNISLKCVTSCSWATRYLGASWGSFALKFCVLMKAIRFEFSSLIMRGYVFSLAITFFISVTVYSSWFIHDVKAINCKSPCFALGSYTFKSVKAKLCRYNSNILALSSNVLLSEISMNCL